MDEQYRHLQVWQSSFAALYRAADKPSLWPLLRRDGLALQYVVMSLLYAWLMGTFCRLPQHWLAKLIHLGSYAGLVAIHAAEQIVGNRLSRYPDLWVVGNVVLCFGSYMVAWAWTLRRLWIETRNGEEEVKPKTE